MYSVRSTTHSPLSTVVATLAGAGLMFFLDPRSGRRRRALLKDQVQRGLHESREFVRKVRADAENRTQGLLHQSRSALYQEMVDDTTLAERVRAALGRLSSHPGALEVFCINSVVHLRGDILAIEVPQVLRGVRHVRGVKDVVDELRVYESPRFIPALQGGREPIATAHFEYLQDNWSPAPRALAGAVGFGLLAGSLGSARLGGTNAALGAAGAALAGAAILLRAISNRPLSRLMKVEALEVAGGEAPGSDVTAVRQQQPQQASQFDSSTPGT